MLMAAGHSNEVGLANLEVKSYQFPWVAQFKIDRKTGENVMLKGVRIEGVENY
jgi:hypothetical protein